MAFLISIINPINVIAGAAQRVRYGRLIDETWIDQPPVFIIGHWRSGTTYLHELMHLDSRFVSPTTYQCFAPHHFLLTQWQLADAQAAADGQHGSRLGSPARGRIRPVDARRADAVLPHGVS
jgi:hypothetical protein